MKMYNFGELSKIVQEKFEDEFPVRMHAKIKDRSDWHDFLVRAEKEMKGVGIKTYHSDLTGKYIRISFVGASEKKVLDWLGKYEKILPKNKYKVSKDHVIPYIPFKNNTKPAAGSVTLDTKITTSMH